MHNMFASTLNLVTIKELKISETTGFYATTFSSANSLENIAINGLITSDIDLHWSTRLSQASIESILSAAYERPNPDANRITVTLSKTAVDKAYETTEGANDGSTGHHWVDGWAANANFNINLL